MALSGRIYIFLMMAALGVSPLIADTYFVRQNGNDWGGNGKTSGTAFATVLRAAQVVNNGDKIVIGPGTYSSAALIADRWGTTVNKLVVVGDENGKLTGDKAGAVVLTPTTASEAALTFSQCKNLQITGLTFHGPGQGIKLEKCSSVVIERCTFDGLSRGIAVENTDGLQIATSVLTRNTLGIFVKGSSDVNIHHVSVAGATTAGILILQSGTGSIEKSLFANNNSNFVADDISAPSWHSDYNVLTGITGPWGAVPTIANVYEWNSASDQDRHSVYVMPAFVNAKNYDLHIDPNVTWGGGLPGMNVGFASTPELDRDGKPLRIRNGAVNVGAYDYPDEVPATGWKKLNHKMNAEHQRQSAGIYKPDGTLIRTLLADACGVRELWWDGLDDMGQPAPAGPYEVRSITHNIWLLDDGAIGDNGNLKGTYNCDNADRVVVLPDGGFAITAVYDEAGYTLRRYSSSGQSIFASALVDGEFWGLATLGDTIIGGRGKGKDAQIVRLIMPGERAPMATGADYYSIFGIGETGTGIGLAVKGNLVYASIAGLNIVRVIDLTTGLKTADWPVANVSDIACDSQGAIWVISGTDVVSLTADGKIDKRIATGLTEANYLTAGSGKLAVNDRKKCRIAIIDIAAGKVSNSFGQDRTKDYWMPVKPDTFRDPRGMAMYPDGRLIVTEHARVRILSPDKLDASVDLVSNFMETAVVHPQKPEYVYCGLGLYQVDEKTGAWKWVLETPTAPYFVAKDEDVWAGKRIGSPGLSVVLGGRPFIGFYNSDGKGSLKLFDVTDSLKPRLALDYDNKDKVLGGWAYDTICFTKDNSIVYGRSYTQSFNIIKFTGLDKDNNPSFDFAHPTHIGNAKETGIRNMTSINAITSDTATGDIYFLAVTDQFKKMVPGWGADGTGVGRVTADATPKWFARSSGGNYMSISSVNDGKQTWVMAAKSFGGQVDVFDPDGLRITTGNWSEPSGYSIGFVDMRYGIHSYLRADGKPGAYIEDDAIGRFARYRMEGGNTLKKTMTPFAWDNTGVIAGNMPQSDKTAGENLEKMQTVPKVEALTVNGDWSQWEKAGVSPQIIGLPCNVGFKRTMADGLMQSFREGTMIGAIAHDGANFYVYFVAADDTPLFEATTPVDLWRYDGIELWIEEEQFGLSLMKDGKPGIFKWRFHDRAGAEWKAGYGLPKENVWGEKIADLSANKLGQRLESITGTSFAGKPGFAVMAKIPFEEVKLVGGIAGREGKVLSMTGQPGELVRFAVSLNNISLRGRSQDYMIDWPAGRMYADPTRSYPFMMGKGKE
ncbi:MAG: NosD domain-containing protein [bacterium]